MQVAKWGNSLGVRLPMALVNQLGISEGDEINVIPLPKRKDSETLTVQVSREPTKKELLLAMRKYRGYWPKDAKFDREEANAR
jgi:antitoxin MazE